MADSLASDAVVTDVHTVAARALDEVGAATDLGGLDEVRSRYLGRRDGLLTRHRKQLGGVPAAARREVGQTVNALFERVEQALDERRRELDKAAAAARWEREAVDLTRPALPLPVGYLHPITRATRDVRRIFAQLGYSSVSGPEVEYDRYNFTLVNMPPGHPARDTQATFFIDESRLLRTQTSPVQIRSMVAHGAPLRVIVPGKTFRRDHDATHSPMFFQVEGLCVDEGISVGDLKGTLEYFARSMFGPDRELRIRPHHFPYTEPSLELDVSCMGCAGSGCSLCRRSGWLEVLGSGLVHPQVLRNAGVDADRYTGFAFGMGVERVAMLAYGIPDIRLCYENDVRFLRPVADW